MAEKSGPGEDSSAPQPAVEIQQQRRPKRIVITAAVAVAVGAVVTVAGFAYYLDMHKYPSENTPLILQPWGISWVHEQDSSGDSNSALSFGSMRLSWSRDPLHSSYSTPQLNCTTFLSSTIEFELPDNLTTLRETYLIGWTSDWLSDSTLEVNVVAPHGVFVVDANGNGQFDDGDSISIFRGVYQNDTLIDQGFRSAIEYGIALEPGLQFMYAIHHGDLYAWQDYWLP